MTKAKVSPILVKFSLCKSADSPDPLLLAQNGIQSPFESPHENFENFALDSVVEAQKF